MKVVSTGGQNWARLAKTYNHEFYDGIYDMALGIEASAKQIAPVDTGNFRGSIRTIWVGSYVVAIISDVEYAAHLEYGTIFMVAIPTFRPAYEMNRKASVAHPDFKR
jgi:hypothetical protein